MMTLTLDSELEKRLEALGATTKPVKEQFVRAAITEAPQRIEEQESEAAQWSRVEAEMESAFAGPTVELTDAVWDEILSAKGDPTPGSLAVLPPSFPEPL